MQIHTSVTAYTCITISSPVEMYGKTQVLGLFFPSPKPTTLFIQQIIFQQIVESYILFQNTSLQGKIFFESTYYK